MLTFFNVNTSTRSNRLHEQVAAGFDDLIGQDDCCNSSDYICDLDLSGYRCSLPALPCEKVHARIIVIKFT